MLGNTCVNAPSKDFKKAHFAGLKRAAFLQEKKGANGG